MKLFELQPAPGSKKLPKRKGRGHGTGNGKTAGRGHKGQNARSGGGVRPDLKVDKCLSTEEFQREVSLIYSPKCIQKLMYRL